MIRGAVAQIFDGIYASIDTRSIVEWFDMGGELDLGDMSSAKALAAAAKTQAGCAAACMGVKPGWRSTRASQPRIAG